MACVTVSVLWRGLQLLDTGVRHQFLSIHTVFVRPPSGCAAYFQFFDPLRSLRAPAIVLFTLGFLCDDILRAGTCKPNHFRLDRYADFMSSPSRTNIRCFRSNRYIACRNTEAADVCSIQGTYLYVSNFVNRRIACSSLQLKLTVIRSMFV